MCLVQPRQLLKKCLYEPSRSCTGNFFFLQHRSLRKCAIKNRLVFRLDYHVKRVVLQGAVNDRAQEIASHLVQPPKTKWCPLQTKVAKSQLLMHGGSNSKGKKDRHSGSSIGWILFFHRPFSWSWIYPALTILVFSIEANWSAQDLLDYKKSIFERCPALTEKITFGVGSQCKTLSLCNSLWGYLSRAFLLQNSNVVQEM